MIAIKKAQIILLNIIGIINNRTIKISEAFPGNKKSVYNFTVTYGPNK